MMIVALMPSPQGPKNVQRVKKMSARSSQLPQSHNQKLGAVWHCILGSRVRTSRWSEYLSIVFVYKRAICNYVFVFVFAFSLWKWSDIFENSFCTCLIVYVIVLLPRSHGSVHAYHKMSSPNEGMGIGQGIFMTLWSKNRSCILIDFWLNFLSNTFVLKLKHVSKNYKS